MPVVFSDPPPAPRPIGGLEIPFGISLAVFYSDYDWFFRGSRSSKPSLCEWDFLRKSWGGWAWNGPIDSLGMVGMRQEGRKESGTTLLDLGGPGGGGMGSGPVVPLFPLSAYRNLNRPVNGGTLGPTSFGPYD